MLLKAAKLTVIYFIIAELFYLALDLIPTALAFPCMLLFYLIHIVGISIVGLCSYFFQFSSESLPHFLFSVIIVAINAGIVFVFTMIKDDRALAKS
jgi:hypothetical protein